MTLTELEKQREDLCFAMIEAKGKQFYRLEEELLWIEELIREQLSNQGETDEEN